MNVLSSVILQGLETSNLLSFLTIFLCVGAMVTFLIKAAIILRVQGVDPIRPIKLNHNSHIPVSKIKMTQVYIPFTFHLLETGNNSFEEVCFSISSQVKYSIQAFWGVSIKELHLSLWRPWQNIKDDIKTTGTVVDREFIKYAALSLQNQEPTNEKIIRLKSPEPPLVLGAPPRLAYPLVVFLTRETDEENDKSSLHPDETVLLINVVHLRDPVCPLPTSILAQYLKQANGQLSCLKQLYLATVDTSSSDESSKTSQNSTVSGSPRGSLSLAEPVACTGPARTLLCSDGPQSERLCVVCQYFPLSRALLPCRHACVCGVCFSKLDRCPMCRGPILNYFCIRSEEYMPPTVPEPRSHKTKVTIHWLDALNDRLTDFLGFR